MGNKLCAWWKSTHLSVIVEVMWWSTPLCLGLFYLAHRYHHWGLWVAAAVFFLLFQAREILAIIFVVFTRRWMWDRVTRPIIFLFDPETAHHMVLRFLSIFSWGGR